MTAVRVKDALDAVGAIVSKLILAVRGASSLTLIAAALVLGGALGRRPAFPRLRCRGAQDAGGDARTAASPPTRLNISSSASPTVVFGVAAGSLAAALVVTRLMEFSVCLRAGEAAGAAFVALFVTVVLGLLGTFSALGRKPAEVLQKSLDLRRKRRRTS